MIKNISILNLLKFWNKYLNKKININGWIKNKFIINNIIFLNINDGSCINSIQIVIKNNLSNINKIKKIISGYSINVIGIISKSKGNKQNIEIIPDSINILGKIYNSNKYPLSQKKHSFEYLRKISHLRPRTYFFSSLTRIRNSIYNEIHNFLNIKKFLWIPTPIITSTDTEGSSKMFDVNYSNNKKKYFFNKKVFLTVSGQLNLETYACSMSKVYSFGPVFRAESSNTRKHLSEFWMVEIEIAFIKFKDIIKFSENFIKNIFKKILLNNIDDISYINSKINKNTIDIINYWIRNKFLILEYKKIINILNKNKFIINWGENINSNHEKFLLKKFNIPIFIINFPINLKPFYMKINDDLKTVSSMDLIFPNVGEIIGGSERENNLEKIKKSMKKFNIKNKWYMDLRKYGTIPHSGFGLGLERLILLITGIENIKDISPFPRSQNYILC